MIKDITTKSGFCVSVDMDMLDNVEFLDALAELSESGLGMSKIATMLLGTDGKKTLYNHVRSAKGTVPAEKLMNEFTEIMELLGAKN